MLLQLIISQNTSHLLQAIINLVLERLRLIQHCLCHPLSLYRQLEDHVVILCVLQTFNACNIIHVDWWWRHFVVVDIYVKLNIKNKFKLN